MQCVLRQVVLRLDGEASGRDERTQL